jgi:hypothetical protein
MFGDTSLSPGFFVYPHFCYISQSDVCLENVNNIIIYYLLVYWWENFILTISAHFSNFRISLIPL